MPRTARVVAVGAPHHVTQRGNNRQQVFFTDAQRRRYLALLGDHADRYQLRILGYCLMPNHVHAVVVPERKDSMAQGFGRAHSVYSRLFNRQRGRSGHLWQNRFYSAPLDRLHLLRALWYVDQNPVRAGLVGSATEYPWSSARSHAGESGWPGLVDERLWREVVPLGDWADVLATPETADGDWQARLRDATYSGKPLGSQGFVAELEREYGASLEPRGPGRPRKKRAIGAASGG